MNIQNQIEKSDIPAWIRLSCDGDLCDEWARKFTIQNAIEDYNEYKTEGTS